MQAGKTAFASLLSSELRCDALHLGTAVCVETADTLTYMERLDWGRIRVRLASFRAHGEGILDGICTRQVLANADIAAEDVFNVYVASVSVPTDGNVLWHEAVHADLEELLEGLLDRQVAIYHRDWNPHELADAIVIRGVSDEALHFLAPNGQKFDIPETLWHSASIGTWRPLGESYLYADPRASLELISEFGHLF